MKLKLVLLSLLSCLQITAQQTPALFGLHSNITNTVFSSIAISGGAYSELSSPNIPYSPVIDKTTFDRVGARYFVKSGSTIYVFNASTGKLTDSLSNHANFHNIEYDAAANSLVGVEKQGAKYYFKILHLGTKLAQLKDTFEPVLSLVIGESTFDTQSRRYFTLTDLGLIVVEPNGEIGDVLCASPYLNGIEYNPLDNKIYYLELNGGTFVLNGLESTTCSIGLIGFYSAISSVKRGESTFNASLGHYFCRSNLGILEIDTQSGQIVQTLNPTNNFARMEFADLRTLGISESESAKGLRVFPNPSSGVFNFTLAKAEGTLEVQNALAQVILRQTIQSPTFSIDLSTEQPGVYVYRIKDSSGSSLQGKLVIE